MDNITKYALFPHDLSDTKYSDFIAMKSRFHNGYYNTNASEVVEKILNEGLYALAISYTRSNILPNIGIY